LAVYCSMNEQNAPQKNSLQASDVTVGMIVKLDRYYAKVTEVERIEKKKGGFRYFVSGLTIAGQIRTQRSTRKKSPVTPGMRAYAAWNSCTTKVREY
jgi:hypothetical protein